MRTISMVAITLLSAALGLGVLVTMTPDSTASSRLLCQPRAIAVPTAAPTEEWTPDYVSGLSDAIHRSQNDQNDRTAARLIEDGTSVLTLPRHTLIATRLDRRPGLEETAAMSSMLLVGQAVEQHLEWGAVGEFDIPGLMPRLVSTFEVDSGERYFVEQAVGIFCYPDLALGSGSWNPALPPNQRLAIFVEPSPSINGVLGITNFHSFEVAEDGQARRLNNSQTDRPWDLTLDQLTQAFADSNLKSTTN